MSEQQTLQPGTVIRPMIDPEGVKILAKKLYGISVLELTELNGYDDRNYKIIVDPNVKSPFITNPSPHGYVLKIINSIDSENISLVEAQNEIMNYLVICSVTCPRPVRNIYSHFHAIDDIGGKRHAVRLLEYVPGVLLKDVPKSPALLYQLGEFVATLDNKLKNFNHSGLITRQHIWMLTMVPELDKFKYVITDYEKLSLVEEVIEEFKDMVIPRLDKLERGVIHGDVNEMNVLVSLKPGGSDSGYRISGIIDFGDIQYSCYVFEVAITMMYTMLVTGDLKAGGIVLAGYMANRQLPEEECMLLKTLVSARLVQSLVLGAYTIKQDPKNTYVNSTERAGGWGLLSKIRKSKPDELGDPADWKRIAEEYLAMR